MPELDQSTYLLRKDELAGHIRLAGEDYQRASYQQALGNATADDVAAAKATLDALKAQDEALDLAWQQQQANSAASAREADSKARLDMIAFAEGKLTVRAKAGKRLETAAHELIAAFREFDDAGTAIIESARPFMASVGIDAFLDLRRDAEDRPHIAILAGMLNAAGINFAGIGGEHAMLEHQNHSVEERVSQRNKRISGRLKAFAPQEVEA